MTNIANSSPFLIGKPASCDNQAWQNGSIFNLVGGFNHIEKYDSFNGKDDIPYI